MYVCTYVRMYVCTYVRMYVCMTTFWCRHKSLCVIKSSNFGLNENSLCEQAAKLTLNSCVNFFVRVVFLSGIFLREKFQNVYVLLI